MGKNGKRMWVILDGAMQDEKEIKTDIWISDFVKAMEQGMKVKISPHGGSMLPFIIGDRDEAVLIKPEQLKRGDVVLYRRKNGIHVLHRIHHIEKEKGTGKEYYYMIGDSQVEIEGPLERIQILGVADGFVRKGKAFSKKNVIYQIWYRIWLYVIPIRPKIIHIWWAIHKIFGKIFL